MKSKFSTIAFSAIMLLSLSLGCSKQELAQPDPGKVIKLLIIGASTEDLEFIYNDKIVAATLRPGQLSLEALLQVKESGPDLQVRKKGSAEILQQTKLAPVPYNQQVSIYYDGTKLYNGSTALTIKGYAISGELEFLMGSTVLYTGTGVINTTSPINIPIDKGTTREVTIRKKGETTVLATKTISSDAKQSLNFFFDGVNLVNNVKLELPANPANMFVSAKFETIFPLYFKNVDVDLVFFVKNTASGTVMKTSPEIRLTIPTGQFSKIELPPLPGPSPQYVYSFDIYEKGTNTVPYTTTTAPFINALFPFKQNEGLYGGTIAFEANKSMLLLIKDSRTLKTTLPRNSYLSGSIDDLSQYFQ